MRKLPQSFAQDLPRKSIRQVAQLKRGIKTTPTRDRVVWDYDLVGSSGDFQFKSDTTYYVSGASDLSNVILEGGSVIKFAPRGGGAVPRVLVHGNIDCQTSLYKQAVFTAKDDDTSGAIISGSSGAPSGEYAYHGLIFNSAGANVYLHDLRISYAFLGCSFYFRATNVIQSAVFTHCTYAVDPYTTTLYLRNVLIDQCGTAIPATSATVDVQHMTAANCTTLLANGGSSTFNLINCLYINTTDNTGSTTGYSGSNNGSGSVTAVGAGLSYYGSGTTGTSSIDSSLAADLQTRTTYPPTILTNPILTATTLTPVVQRGYSGSPVRGYFYPPIDYALSNVVVTNATVVLTNGVVVTAAGPTGFLLQDGAHIKSSGSPTAPNRFVRYNMVQEGITLWGTGTGAASFFSITNSPGSSPSIDLTFTEILTPAAEVARTAILANNNSIIDSFSLRHCLVWNGSLDIAALSNQSSIMTFGFTNTFFWRPDFRLSQGCTNDTTPFYLQLWNNTFIVGTVKLTNASPASTNLSKWAVYDNLFSFCGLSAPGNTNIPNGYNGYMATTALTGGSNNQTPGSWDFVTGPLGGFYYPTVGSSLHNLENAGSRNATNAGLYHFTTRVDQTKEASSTVDIGYHFVATTGSSSTTPTDYDSDGLPDWLEDWNGNGSVDSGETSWTDAADLGFQIFITRPATTSNLP